MSESSNRRKVLVTGGPDSSQPSGRLSVERGSDVRCLVRRSSNLRYLKHPEIELQYGGLDDSTDWDEALAMST